MNALELLKVLHPGARLMGSFDALGTIASGAVAEPVAGLAGLTAAGMGGGPEKAATAVRKVKDGLVRAPATPEGAQELQNLATLFSPLTAALDWAREHGGEAGYNLAGPVGGAVGEALPEVLTTAAGALKPLTQAVKTARGAGKLARQEGSLKVFQQKQPEVFGMSPKEIAIEAKANVMPESPALKEVFGVTRRDLADIADRPGTHTPPFPGQAAKPKGAASASKVMIPENSQRIYDILDEVGKEAPEMWTGMKGWYVSDPLEEAFIQALGPEEGTKAFLRFNNFSGIESRNMPVIPEMQRASYAAMMNRTGNWEDWLKYGGKKPAERPEHLRAGYPGRMGFYSDTTKGIGEMQNDFLLSGSHSLDSPKVPMYIEASGTPRTGFQTTQPVMDAHFSNAIGLPSVRTSKNPYGSITTPEAVQIAPWFRDIAKAHELEAVPAQAILWGGMGKRTGVATKVGAPKLELYADQVMKAIPRMEATLGRRVTPKEALERIVSEQDYLGNWMAKGK